MPVSQIVPPVRFLMWLFVLVNVAWYFGLWDCRMAAWWKPGQKIQGYVRIPSKRLALLFISRFEGYNVHFNTNIPFYYNRWVMNQYPERMSYVGVLHYCITLPLVGWWTFEITRYFWAFQEGNKSVFHIAIILIVRCIIIRILVFWNDSKTEAGPEITKEELQAICKAEKQARKNEKRVRS